jgi:tetratricopeptide (TPR) repeat protein
MLAALIAAAAAGPYIQTYAFDFITFDDGLYVTENVVVRDGLTPEGFVYAFTTGESATWQPLTWLSHMLDVELFGLWAGGHHLMNVFFHALNSVLLFLVLRRLAAGTRFDPLWPSALAAAVFALHPFHVESVAWISERKDVLSTLFWVLAMGAYARHAGNPRWTSYLLVTVLFALGLMAKPMLVTLPCVFLLLDFWPLGRLEPFTPRRVFRLVMEKAPWLAFSALSSALTFMVQAKAGAVNPHDIMPLAWRLENALVAYVLYLYKTFVPINFAVFYPHPEGGHPLWMPIAAGVLLLVLSAAAVVAARRAPYAFVGWFWFLGTLVPVIGIIQVGTQAMADRYSYVPMIGLTILVGWGAQHAAGRRFRRTLWIGLAALAVVLGALTWQQTALWRDTYTLFRHAAAVVPQNALAEFKTGNALVEMGRYEEAEGHFENAIAIKPAHSDARRALAKIHARRGDYQSAFSLLGQGLQLRPNDAGLHNAIGATLLELGQLQRAIPWFEKAVELDPEYDEAQDNLAAMDLLRGNYAKAERHFRQVVEEHPRDAVAHTNLGVAVAEQGRVEEARPHFERALKIDPDYAPALNNMRRFYGGEPGTQ